METFLGQEQAAKEAEKGLGFNNLKITDTVSEKKKKDNVEIHNLSFSVHLYRVIFPLSEIKVVARRLNHFLEEV